jgi:hypothetical protein
MSVPPIADIAERDRDVRFVPIADSCGAAKKLFDHLVCKCEKIGQNGEVQRLGGFQIQRAHPCEGQDGRMTALPVV